ncbi:MULTISPECIES: dicarboxylate/amino acid:cation symporter [Peptoniphilus]|jgi:serine/threonine transporter|uniref:dicarboxylate/amino acid:cation symporter n=1 Tax=Peptoniphilus TaxID=162289 RepID=UPI0002899236|nr:MULTISPECIES: dicarboxylate/amino acid:cation symporter [Peptoniphilus]MBS6610196.1 dicarboxylate/amino acid:cation symporter [Peptoniphilus harei]MDU1043312.1 dicarboxylate/amino acid:cation symporter [Peptoniphilus rhinitidis]MDU1954028.1 dicarboxylate/amino acid:cation symporter [Peptoniphilus lacydonensis]MDU2110113.1 dicarboxylate/amino acid:cation symporter [Peptoniphilus lacydonensis]MDU2115267.1 dicarboxylate/amino acid:cation symporter [Peptoniphilus lacydonensis]
MKKKKFFNSLVFKLILGIIIGIIVGNISNVTAIRIIDSIKRVIGSLIGYIVPLIILGFITPAIVSLKENAGKVLGVTLIICYASSVGAATMSFLAGKAIIPNLNIASNVGGGNSIPESIFNLSIDPIMPVMTALVTSILFGIAVIVTESNTWENLLLELNKIILFIVNNVVIKILPVYIATTFAGLSYEGVIVNELPVFLKVIVIVIIGHFIWMTLMYSIAGAVSKTNPKEVFRHYVPAYLTAVGTMSSAATLSVALKCARKSKTLDPKIRDFAIPLCSNTHLCGSVLTEVFFVMTVSQILTGKLPETANMIAFILLLGIFAIAAPGVPGGTVVASLGLITSVLGFNDTGTALMLSIFALQDSFGTACNVTTDGAIALMVTGIFKKVPGRGDNPEVKVAQN